MSNIIETAIKALEEKLEDKRCREKTQTYIHV